MSFLIILNYVTFYWFSRKKPRHDSDDFYAFIPKGSGGLLSKEMEEISGLYYRPRTKESREIYELLLTFIQQCIGDQVNNNHTPKYLNILANNLTTTTPTY